jgi:hypothetical protein
MAVSTELTRTAGLQLLQRIDNAAGLKTSKAPSVEKLF